MLRWLGMRPLLVVVPPFLAGALIGRFSWIFLAAALLIALLTLILRLHRAFFLASWALVAFMAGAFRMKMAETVKPDDLLNCRFEDEHASAVGTISEIRETKLPLSDVGHRFAEGLYGSFELDVEEIRLGTVAAPLRGRLRVQFQEEQTLALIGGERVRVRGLLRTPAAPTNPGQFDRRLWLKRRGIGATLLMDKRDPRWTVLEPGIEVLSAPSLLPRWRAALRHQLDAGARPEVAAFMSSLTIGDRAGMSDELRDQFQWSGTAHFLAVSGFNVMLVVGGAYWILTLLGVSDRTRAWILIGVAIFYTMLAGGEASVARAGIMSVVWLSADLIGRRRDSMSALAAAAFIIVLADPMQLYDVGFQLSFMAVFGILGVSPVWAGFLSGLRPRFLVGGLSVSLASWLMTEPVVQGTFNLITPCVLAANLLFSPFILVETIFAVLTMALAPIGAGAIPGWMAGVTFDALLWLSKRLTSIPFAYLYVPSPPMSLILLYYAGLAAWLIFCRTGWRPAFALVLILPLASPVLLHRKPRELTVTSLDVGPGLCTYVEMSDGRSFLFDVGSSKWRDAGESIAAPYLWSRGVTHVEVLMLSHADADHINGARAFIERFRVKMIVTTRYLEMNPAGHALLEWARARGIEVLTPERQDLADGIEVLGPRTWEKYARMPGTNDSSLVLRIEKRLLLTGDIMSRSTRALLDEVEDVRADVMVVPHHGRKQDHHAELSARVAPRLAVISGLMQDVYPPLVETLRPYSDVRITETSGAITVTLGPEPRVWTFLGD